MAEQGVAEAAVDTNAIDQLASLFSTDTMMASQFNDMRRRKSAGDEGISKLWVAVLEDGIRCFLGAGDTANDGDGATWQSRRSRLQQEAREWIFESNYEGPFSFSGLCESLGIDPDYIRENLAKSDGARAHPRRVRETTRGFGRLHRNAMGRL
jgi:hypothetical protein